MFQILQGGKDAIMSLIASGAVVACSLFIVHVAWKSRSFVAVVAVAVLAGFVLFAVNNPAFLQSNVCQGVAYAAKLGGITGPTC